jgi:hypothetical protein
MTDDASILQRAFTQRSSAFTVAIWILFAQGCAPASSGGGSGGTSGGSGGSSGTGGTAEGTGGSSRTGGASGSGGTGSGGATGTGGAAGQGTGGAAGTGGAGGRGTDGGAGAGGAADGGTAACPTANEEKFSFFLISNAELIRQGGALAGNPRFSTYGGNLGGLVGADKICQTAAEHVSPCQSAKVWRAFLSTPTVNAIERIGTGPWYDRNGRLWSANLTNLVKDRPSDADPAIKNNAPNENGALNKNPDGTGDVDNHEIATGTGANGRTYTQTASTGAGAGTTNCGADLDGTAAGWNADRATCWGWTRNTKEGCPRMGRSWCSSASCTPAGGGSGTNWMSAWNAVGCAPGGTLAQSGGGTPSTRQIGSAGGYGGFYCFAVRP